MCETTARPPCEEPAVAGKLKKKQTNKQSKQKTKKGPFGIQGGCECGGATRQNMTDTSHLAAGSRSLAKPSGFGANYDEKSINLDAD